mmetsp:Transcript_16330/g.32884  ORF Transcript_16330/g.32884 Transcript_16330/m.32884 type:complete len:825 (-) Transcript_16330:10-2484(-)|eukprot:scaffold9735_cov174-Amphora_coffeaeformis.AAC.6
MVTTLTDAEVDLDGFDGSDNNGMSPYSVQTKETPLAFLVVVGVLAALSLFYIFFHVFCLPSWNHLKSDREREQNAGQSNATTDNEVPSDGTGPMSESENRTSVSMQMGGEESISLLQPDSQPNAVRPRRAVEEEEEESFANTGLHAPSTSDRASAIPSTTSSSRMRQNTPDRPIRTWDLSNMRWKHRGPLSRVQNLQRSVESERHIQLSSEDGSNASRSRSSWNSRPGGRAHSHRGVSDVASSILDQGNVEGEAQFYRQRYMERNRNRRRRDPNSSASSVRSALPELSPDAVSPDEAADAHDPGTLNQGYTYDFDDDGVDCLNCCSPVGNLLDYSDLDFETRRILTLTFPSTIEAITDPFFRMGVVALLSHFVDTDSMVAFLLVSFLLRTSIEEVSGAVADAQSTLLQEALIQGGNIGFNLAGRFVQLGILMQILLVGPMLAMWAVFMEDVVSWLVPESPDIAQIASGYAKIIVVEFGCKAVSRAFMLVFHLTGQAQFELNVDLSMTALTIAIISIASSASDDISLNAIGWIQVLIAAGTTIGKIVYMFGKGMLKPYQEGLLVRFLEIEKVKTYLSIAFPLLVGSIVETGEWEVLLFLVQHLGGAEVATWALMGIVWEVFQAFTEGLGEASAVRVSYYLSENLPDLAKQLANKAVFLSMIESTILTALFLTIGPNLSVALTRDAVLQNLFNDLVPMVALANVVMANAQIYWSLVGAQGYFSRASGVVLANRWLFIVPLGFTLIYSSLYDLLCVAGAIAAGYTIGGTILANMIIRSDWAVAAQLQREELGDVDAGYAMDMEDAIEDEEEGAEEEESEDDSSTGFG